MKNIKIKIKKLNKNIVFLIKKTLLKHPDKTNNIFSTQIKFKIGNFNKFLIFIISFLFLYLFYLSIPTLYDKTWVQKTIENKLLDEFKINFSISSDISYEILPSPHFTVKNAKIYKGPENQSELSEIKKLKIFINQKNFFNKKNIAIKKVIIKDANFIIHANDTSFFSKFIKDNTSKKKIFIKDSNLFFRNSVNKTYAILKIYRFELFYDDLKFVNKIRSQNEIFKIPFIFDLENNNIDKKNYFKIFSKKFRIKFENDSSYEDISINGSNKTSILNFDFKNKFKFEDNSFLFESKKDDYFDNEIDYRGKVNLDPFNLIFKLDLKNIKFKNLIRNDTIFFEFLKSGKVFNENISANILINSEKISDIKIFDSLEAIINFNNGIINFNQSEFQNDKIGLVKIVSSKMFFEDNLLKFSGDFNVIINNQKNFFKYFQTPKKYRKKFENIFFSLDFNLTNNDFKISKIMINDKSNIEIQNTINVFNSNKKFNINNMIEFKNFVNLILTNYSG